MIQPLLLRAIVGILGLLCLISTALVAMQMNNDDFPEIIYVVIGLSGLMLMALAFMN